MKMYSRRTAQREREYRFWSALDLTTNFLLCCGVFALACAILGVILMHKMPSLAPQVVGAATQFFR